MEEATWQLALCDVTASLIIEQRSKLELGKVQGGIRRSPSTCNRYVAALRHAFTIASHDWEWLPDNPVRRVVKLREPRGRIRCLHELERRRLLRECQASKAESSYVHQNHAARAAQ